MSTVDTLSPRMSGPLIMDLEDYTDAEVARQMELLPAWRRDQAMRFRHQGGRRQCVMAYVALCQLLREQYGIEDMPDFDYNEHGKPLLRQHPQIHFSLSHCRRAVGCLVADAPCGLDLETVRPLRDSLVRYTMNEAEAEHILSAEEPDVAFLSLWTQKEAVLKLRGTGIRGSMKEVLAPQNLAGIRLRTRLWPGPERLVCSWATIAAGSDEGASVVSI